MEVYFEKLSSGKTPLEKLVDDVFTLVNNAEQLVKATSGELTDASKDEVFSAVQRLKQTCQRIKGHAQDTAQAAGRAIQRNPYTAVGGAFGVGLILGLWLGRR